VKVGESVAGQNEVGENSRESRWKFHSG
jgi:hypothetical protein